jgi:multicomponent Na+:H+ antiporter subunit E
VGEKQYPTFLKVLVSQQPANRISDHPEPLAAPPEQAGWQSHVTTAAIVYLVWLLLVGTLDRQEALAGLAIAGITAYVSGPYLAVLDGLRLSPALPWHLLRYLAVFLHALLLANVDMARRVLSPRLPIQPDLVEITTGLESRLGKLILANSITLTPGTLTVDVVGNRLYVHWIDTTPGSDTRHATEAIAARFERYLRGFVK